MWCRYMKAHANNNYSKPAGHRKQAWKIVQDDFWYKKNAKGSIQLKLNINLNE